MACEWPTSADKSHIHRVEKYSGQTATFIRWTTCLWSRWSLVWGLQSIWQAYIWVNLNDLRHSRELTTKPLRGHVMRWGSYPVMLWEMQNIRAWAPCGDIFLACFEYSYTKYYESLHCTFLNSLLLSIFFDMQYFLIFLLLFLLFLPLSTKTLWPRHQV